MKKNIEKIKSEKTISELLEFGIINIDKPAGPTSFDVIKIWKDVSSHFSFNRC